MGIRMHANAPPLSSSPAITYFLDAANPKKSYQRLLYTFCRSTYGLRARVVRRTAWPFSSTMLYAEATDGEREGVGEKPARVDGARKSVDDEREGVDGARKDADEEREGAGEEGIVPNMVKKSYSATLK